MSLSFDLSTARPIDPASVLPSPFTEPFDEPRGKPFGEPLGQPGGKPFGNPFDAPFEQRLARALDDLRGGRPVLLMDDDDRENEADLILSADTMGVAEMARLIRDCSGIVCLCLPEDDLARLNLPPMVTHNESRFSTAFTISIEARHGVSTGVSAADRLTTIRAAIAPDARSDDLVSPGHVFPLRARRGGVLARRGHTEGSVDLVRLAGLRPAAVLCELMNADGTMARGDDVARYAARHDLVALTIAELADHRLRTEEGAAAPLSRTA